MEISEGCMGFTMKEKQALNRKEKTGTLDEYIRLTGYHRKYALHILPRGGKEIFLTVDGKPIKLKAGTAKRWKGGGRKPVYGPEMIVFFRIIWAFFWFCCGKFLAPLIRDQILCFETWLDFAITPDVRKKLLSISPATIDQTLKGDRKKFSPQFQRY
jgi:hypothetical protein